MYLQFLFLGLITGILGGMLGIGGGTIVIPYLVFFCNYTQHQAQGVSLLLASLPVGLLALIKYYKEGNLNINTGLMISLGFFVGGYIGSLVAHLIPNTILKKIFGIYLLIVSLKMIFN
ncbi:MAG: sulfite exporter TauE/SafE family protein [Endomicrobia bacterium]|nr:sulfite exporter TauE/SafE family protein [Endomicrobiia bacterium]